MQLAMYVRWYLTGEMGGANLVAMGDGLATDGAGGHLAFLAGCHVSARQQEHRPATSLAHQTRGERVVLGG